METRDIKKTDDLLPPYERNIPESFEVRFTAQSDWRLWETVAFYLGGVGAGLYVVSQFLNTRAGLLAGFPSPVGSESLSMPFQNRSRVHQVSRRTPVVPVSG